MRQTWRDLTFLHWRCPPAELRPLVPSDLELDLYDDTAWIGLVPFIVAGLTHPRIPATRLSTFPETNVRTYVIDRQGRRGVWFFSLDAARFAAVLGARLAYALPYFWADMSVHRTLHSVHYRSKRYHGRPAKSDIVIDIDEPILTPSVLEIFLTARFRLYARRFGMMLRADVEHPPWPLQRATAPRISETLIQAAGVPCPLGEPLVHFAESVDVLVSRPIVLGR